jgi:multidrug efflux pump subunit AcrB
MDITATDEMVTRFEQYLSDAHLVDPGQEGASGVVNYVSFVGGGEPRFILNANTKQQNPAYALVLINLTDYEAVERTLEDLKAFCAREFPDVLASITMSDMGPPVEKPIQVRISGRDADQVFAYADQVKAKLREIPGSRDITDNWGSRIKKLMVDIDQPRARRAGVSSQDVAVSLQTLLEGLNTTEFREERDTIPIVLRSVAADRQDIAKLESFNVYSQSSGRSVPLMQVADVRVEWESSRIFRRNRLKTVTVEAAVNEGLTASDVGAPLYAWLEETSRGWRAGYRFEQGGEVESSGEAQKAIADKLPLAGGIIVLLLIGQFNSFRRGAIVLLTIPLGMIGVVAGLLLLRSYFGFMTLLGIVSLAGIIINNAIVLIDRIGIEIDENGRSPQEAVIEAAQRRLRPILMTTATTIFGLVPLYLSGGPMWEPMAIAIMFGLAFATVLTLGLVPVLYSLFFGVTFEEYRHGS